MTQNEEHRLGRERGQRARGAHAGDHVARVASLIAFHQRLAEAGRRCADLRAPGRRGAEAGAGPAPDAARALAELDAAWDELRTADEELMAQSEELDRVARQLEAERARYRELFDLAPDAHVLADAAGAIVAANRAAAGLFHVPASKLRGRPLDAFVAPAERGAFLERVARAGLARRPLRWQCTLAAPGRGRGPAPGRAVAVQAASDGRGGVLFTLREVGAKGRRAPKLEPRAEAGVEPGAAHPAAEELLAREREARRRAERAGREREEIIALVAHELRSPLHAVLGWAKLALEGDDPAAQRKALEVIMRNAGGMVALVDDLLDVARIERGAFALVRERVDLGDLLATLCLSFAPVAEARAVSLAFEVADGAGAPVEGDRVRLEQLFGNLLANALKFTPAGGRITVRLEPGGERVLVRVRDTGRGIAPALLPHVFERYRQGKGGPQGPRRGLGLGLAIARHVAVSHGGSVTAESEGEGRGATFTVALPLAGPRPKDGSAAPASGATAPDANVTGDGGPAVADKNRHSAAPGAASERRKTPHRARTV